MTMHKNGFTLVELSIVLVILGLLVGGVLSGQSLIHAAQLRAISTERDKYVAATQTFRDKYFALPGDMANATAFWGKDNTYCPGNTGTAAATGTCNGDGNGSISNTNSASTTSESFQFWKQLALAGLIEGTYTGISSSSGPYVYTLGSIIPASKFSGAGWAAYTISNYGGDSRVYAADYQNALAFGGAPYGADSNYGPILTPADAWNIDTKMDDGKPGTGSVIAVYWNNACATASSNTDYASPYNLSVSTAQCILFFAQQF